MLIKKWLAQYFYFPGWCYACQEMLINQSPVNSLCLSCYQKLPYLPVNTCSFCLANHPSTNCWHKKSWQLTSLTSVFYYRTPLSKWLIEFKYNKKMLAGRILADLLFFYFTANIALFKGYDVLMPVPGSVNSRFLDNQFLPNNYLALNGITSIAAYLDVKKNKNIQKQVFLTRQQREKNMQNPHVFDVRGNLQGQSILLFDDVCTTGATLKNITRILKDSGASSVAALTLFREPYT